MKYSATTLVTLSTLIITASSHAADYSTGVSLGNSGIGANFSVKNRLKFRSDDQTQTRFHIYGINVQDVDGISYQGISYEGDVDSFAARATMDWFPFTNKFFLSTGLDVSKYEQAFSAESNQSYNIGQHVVSSGDNVTTNLNIEEKGVSPYLGIGWGNRIGVESGFSFIAEIGVLIPTSSADIDFSVEDPNNAVSAADIAQEKKQIEKEFDEISAVASIGVMYHF